MKVEGKVGIEIAIENRCPNGVSNADFDSDPDSDFEFSRNPKEVLNPKT